MLRTLPITTATLVLISTGLFPSIPDAAPGAEFATTREGIIGTYRKNVPDDDFATIKARDEKAKPRVMERQRQLLEERYDLSDQASNITMAGGRRTVQKGIRVRPTARPGISLPR